MSILFMERNNAQDRPLVIGIDASRANAEKRTGTEWYAFHVIQELKKLVPSDTEVVLYSKEPLRDGLEDLPAHWQSAVLRWPPGRFWTQARLSFEVLTRPPDLLFVPAHALPAILPERSITTMHDVAFMSLPDAYGRFERLYHRLAAMHAVRSTDVLLTVSEFSKREIMRYFRAAADEIVVTPLGCDTDRFAGARSEDVDRVRGTYRIDGPYFLFVGRIETKKNIEGMLAAYEGFRKRGGQAKFVLVGKRGRGGAEALSKAFNASFKDDIFELGYTSPDDLPALYAGASALVFASRYEGFGIPALEAFAAGTPVIASTTTSLPEVCGDAAYYVHPGDVNGLARAMRRILDEPSLAADLRRLGKERLRRYSWRRTAERTWEAMSRSLYAEKKVRTKKKGHAA